MSVKRALISLSDKTGIIDFAKELHKLDIQILSTGGTAKAIRDSGVPVTDVSEVTGFPEIMNGRVKTLHPKIHGGLLAVRSNDEHMQALKDNSIETIDLVVVNLYPFVEVIKKDITLEDAIENIDIGGPSMLRAAAKNYRDVAVVTDPEDYSEVLAQIKATGEVDIRTKEKLAIKVFASTAKYDAAIDTYLSKRILEENKLHLHFEGGEELRYGENSHQSAVFYADENSTESSVAKAEILNGKAMSYNNYVDANAAYEVVKDIDPATAAVSVIKHTNPCGFATAATAAEALERAWEGDPISAFGGVIACNKTVDMAFAEFLKGDTVTHYSFTVKDGEYLPSPVKTGKFVEVIIAPDFTDEAMEFLKRKSKMIRLLKVSPEGTKDQTTYKAITGGFLVQDKDSQLMDKFEVKTKREFDGNLKELAEFTLIACKHTKSNAIVLGREFAPGQFQVIGMGAGQPNRVDSMRKLAWPKAKENLKREWERAGSQGDFEVFFADELSKMVLASDAFLPFDDTVREAAGLGIKNIVQPGGSMRDEDSIKACDELGLSMAFTGLRHFNH